MATWTAPRWSSKAAGTTKWDMVPWGLDHPWISWNRCGKPVVSAENWSTSGGFFYIYVSLEEDTWMRIPLGNSIGSHATWMGISVKYMGDAMVANHFLQVAGMHRFPSTSRPWTFLRSAAWHKTCSCLPGELPGATSHKDNQTNIHLITWQYPCELLQVLTI